LNKKIKRAKPSPPVFDKAALLRFIESQNGQITKREIAKYFNIKGDERRILNLYLRELGDSGEVNVNRRRDVKTPASPPKSGIFQAVDIDDMGEVWAKSVGEDGIFGPKILIQSHFKADKNLNVGLDERFVGISIRNERENNWEVKVIKKLGPVVEKIYGVLSLHTPQNGGRIIPADKKQKNELLVLPQHLGDAKDGDLVAVRLLPNRGYGPRKCEVVEVLGNNNDPKSASILAIAAHSIPIGFTPEEEEQAEAAQPCNLEYRADLRHLPLVTIDPDDARDHDDAVYAEAKDNGFAVWVAIADVAHYVTTGSPLDIGSQKRGNSVYFPDRVVPMLPFKLSADLCSLREHEERACLAVRMNIDKDGELKGFEFFRGLMKSAARLTYTQAQLAIDGTPDDKTAPILDNVLRPLWDAYAARKIEREEREPLEIASSERRIILSPEGRVESITQKERFDAHRLIEEFMILANVCAATALENKKAPLIYRVHDMPSDSKVSALADFLATLNIKWAKGVAVTPKRFNKVLEAQRDGENFQTINEIILRTQAQAVYDTQNLGHFGLQLERYAHFTSPIRRYADLCVHRSLIDALGLGGTGWGDKPPSSETLKRIAQEISDWERRAMAAERDATDRYLAAFLSERIGAVFEGRITAVTGFGVFVRLDETMGDGLVPVSKLGDEYFVYDEPSHCLIGQYSGDRWELGMKVRVRLLEAAPVSGGLMFEMVSEPKKGLPPKSVRQKLGGRARMGDKRGGLPKGVKSRMGKKRR
jgi:ribonuclease R